MKSKTTDWKLPVLIGVLVIVALLINIFFYNKAVERRESKAQEQRQTAAAAEAKQTAEKLAQEKKDAEEARQQSAKEAEAKRDRDAAEAKTQAEAAHKKATEDVIADHTRFLARYLNSGFTRKPGVATVGVAIESEQGTMNPAIANALSQRFNSDGVQFLNSFFKPEFAADKYVDKIFSGDTGVLDRLELTNWLSGILMGRQTVTYSTNAALGNTISANIRLDTIALPVGLTWPSQSWALSATGVGFNTFDARKQAEDRIIHQIANDPTMALSNFSTNK